MEIERQRETQRPDSRLRLEALQIADLALAEDENAARLEILVEAGERETGLLDVRAGDRATQARGAGQQFERQPERLRTAAEERADRDSCV
jgi:hypothetical protein